MSHPIQTTGMSGGAVTTTQQNGESTGTWIARHDQLVSTATPGGNTLTTTWTSASGAQAVVTTRNPGENDKDFRLRHQYTYLLALWEQQPIP